MSGTGTRAQPPRAEPTEAGRATRHGTRPGWDVLAAVAAGGALGAAARYGISVALPADPAEFPLATLLINTAGCLLLGALMALLAGLADPHRLARPFLGVGVLGGFTTFSTYALEVDRLLLAGRPGAAFGYLAGTVAAALTAVYLGDAAVRRLRRRGRS